MTARVLLVRHAGVTLVDGLAPSEWPLSPEGRNAAERLAGASLFADVAAIASSPEAKALATAEPIAGRCGLEISVEPDLREVERPRGPIVSSEEIERQVADYLDGRAGDWEHVDDARHRVTACIERICQGAAGPIVVVSHGLLLTLYRGDSTGRRRTMPLPALAIEDDDEIGPWLTVDEVVDRS